ncbi:NapC/NirT family cytochrome c [Edwardsiella piscicida]|uniref:NapC/NirT family cytochrome c n=1 Tax=Edwardsiella piscicida TaxID=1263550 RepID=UPI00370DD5EB
MSNRYAAPGRRRRWPWLVLLGIILGIALLAATFTVLHKTSSTEFCVSCHTMQQPLAEYQGSVHFQNKPGIRAECADCHIPQQPLDFLKTKVLALKDVYGELTGKIDTPEKYQAHKLAMAQSVWDTMKANDSATCRSCHSYQAMDIIDQSAEARKQHPVAIKDGETCIDCHKGVAHILPDMSALSAAGASELAAAAAKTPDGARTLYAISTQPFFLAPQAGAHSDGSLMPSTEIRVLQRRGDMVEGELSGWQQNGVNQVIYAAQGKRILSALLGEAARKQVKVLSSDTDAATGLVWHRVTLSIWLPKANLIGSEQPIWRYAADMMSANCTGCHGLTALDRFNANQWIGVVKGMASRTSLNEEQLRLLTQYVQKHASDISANGADQPKEPK